MDDYVDFDQLKRACEHAKISFDAVCIAGRAMFDADMEHLGPSGQIVMSPSIRHYEYAFEIIKRLSNNGYMGEKWTS